MSNELFKELGGKVAQPNSINGLMNEVNQIRNNPSQIGRILYQRGKINQSQLSDIQNMHSPSEIGQYLVKSGVLGNQQLNQFGSMVGQMFH